MIWLHISHFMNSNCVYNCILIECYRHVSTSHLNHPGMVTYNLFLTRPPTLWKYRGLDSWKPGWFKIHKFNHSHTHSWMSDPPPLYYHCRGGVDNNNSVLVKKCLDLINYFLLLDHGPINQSVESRRLIMCYVTCNVTCNNTIIVQIGIDWW